MTSEQIRRVDGAGECPSFEDLMAYADNELDASGRSSVERHLESCRSCAAVLRSQARIEETYREDYREPSRERFDDLEAGLAGRFGHRRQRTAWVLPVAATLLVALAAVKLLGGGNGLLHRTGEEQVQPGSGFRIESPAADMAAVPAETVIVTAEALELEEELLPPPEAALQDAEAGRASALAADDRYQETSVPVTSIDTWNSGGGLFGDLTITCTPGTSSSTETVSPEAQARGAGGMYAVDVLGAAGEDASAVGSGSSPVTAGGTAGYVAGGSGGGGAMGLTSAGTIDTGAECPAMAAQEAATGEDADGQSVMQMERDQSDGAGYSLCRCFEVCTEVVLEFDSLGNASSPDSAYLDACFPGWKDSLDETCAGSILVVPVEELPDLMD